MAASSHGRRLLNGTSWVCFHHRCPDVSVVSLNPEKHRSAASAQIAAAASRIVALRLWNLEGNLENIFGTAYSVKLVWGGTAAHVPCRA
jgi:hypothetical protein